MNSYLLTLSIGPVQGFIAAARRSRDLWFGSYLLSAVAKKAALHLKSLHGTKLIFPCDKDDDLLNPGPERQISNVILAKVETADLLGLVEAVKAAARQAWWDEANDVYKEVQQHHSRHKPPLDQLLWKEQVDDILELYAAWVELPSESAGDYQKAYQRQNELLAARKNTRDFLPAANTLFGIQKSSLDAGRESVIRSDISKPPDRLRLRRQWGIGESEELDCPGLVKRVGGKLALRQGKGNSLEHFTPLSRIAIDPWIRGVSCKDGDKVKRDALLQLIDSRRLDNLVDYDLVSPVKGNRGIYQAFPFDGQLLYPFRLAVEKARAKEHPSDNDLSQKLEKLESAILPLLKDGDPNPYLAILSADGDRMGKLLADQTSCTLTRHQDISKALADFAHLAQTCARRCRGHAIYTGGDDVLALVPLDKAIRCAHALQKKFNKTMAGFGQDLGEKDRPSLSVGIAIGHFLEPLPVLLDLARRAEHLAKGDGEKNSRNALGIILKPRSGGEVEARSQWATDPAKRIDDWVRAFRDGSLPDRTPYLLREAAERLLTLDPSRKSELYKSVLKTSVQRIVQRRQVTGDNGEAARRMEEALRDQLVKAAAADAIGLRVLVGELLIARRIAAVMGQAKASSSDGNATTEGGER